MSEVFLDISVSLDGYVAGPNAGPEHPLGVGGDRLHQWAYGARAWLEEHGREGGAEGVDSDVIAETQADVGATIMGRGMFGGGPGTWDDWEGWWGEEPPFRHPVFVLTHHDREPLTKGATTFAFVTDGVGSALEQARAAAGGGRIRIGGGASVANQYLAAGLVDRFQIHVAPVLLGGGARLFEDVGDLQVEQTRALESPSGVAHLMYRVVR